MKNLKERIKDKLNERKVRNDHKGFIYLSRAIEIYYNDEDRYNCKMQDIYSRIATELSTDATKVNDAIRYVISYTETYEANPISNKDFIVEVYSELGIEDIFYEQERIKAGLR